MRWVKRLSNTDIENLLKKLGAGYENLKIEKASDFIEIYSNDDIFVLEDFLITNHLFRNITFNVDNKIFYLFMENKFGKEYLIDLIRNKTGLSGKFLRKKLK